MGSLHEFYEMTPRDKWDDLHDLSTGSDYGYISRDEYIKGLSELTGQSYDTIKAQQAAAHVRNEALVAYIRELRAIGRYKIALLSNVGRELVESLFTTDELQELFDTVVLSYEVGILKPHPKIYEMTAERLGLESGDCVMIDDLQKNIDGADAAGMRGIVYTDVAALKHELTSVYGV